MFQNKNVCSFQLSELVNGDTLAYLHLRIHQVLLALHIGQKQEWLSWLLLEAGPDRGEVESLGGGQLCGDGIAYLIHIRLNSN